ncbi:MAG: amidohydrolase family protein [Planctomycetes bacterium]|nr:amidohydrolase family protein [Planctomycetota bacterium]
MTQDIPFVDCNCVIGRPGSREPEMLYRTDDILSELEYHNIRGALVHHTLAVEFNQSYGNEALREDIRERERFFGSWVLVPHHAGDMPDPENVVQEMKVKGIRAARIFPKLHQFDTEDYVCGPLFRALERQGIPLFVEITEIDLADVHDICQAHPGMPVVLTGVGWGSDRNLFPVMARSPNLHVETSKYQGHNGLTLLCREFGAERVLFGTGLPAMSPGAAKAMVMYSEISHEEKRMIAGGNLLRLLGAEAPPAYREKEQDEIVCAVEAGRPLEIDVLDAHAHIGHDGCMGIEKTALHDQSAPAMIRSMDRAGIDRAFVSSWIGIIADEKAGNRLIAETLKRYPGRFWGYGTFNPNYPEDIDAELGNCFGQYGMMGVKPYPPRHKYPLDGANNRKVLQFADTHHLPILCHYGGSAQTSVTAAQVEALSETYPNAKFIFAHSGSSWGAAKSCAAVAKKRKNVFLEITYTSVTFGTVEHMAREAGVDRVLYGSDFPMRDPCPQIAWVAYAKLDIEEKKQIFAGNLRRILDDIRL